MPAGIGVDLGHTVLRGAMAGPDGALSMLSVGDGARWLGTTLGLQGGQYVFGGRAERLALSQPDDAVTDVVRRFERDSYVPLAGNNEPAGKLVVALLQRVVSAGRQAANDPKLPVCVATPSGWPAAWSERLVAAAAAFGLPVRTAPADLAAVASVMGALTGGERRVLVVDNGGRQFTASMVSVAGQRLRRERLASRDNISGQRFNEHLAELISSRAAEEAGFDLRHERRMMAELPQLAERAKLDLGRVLATTVSLADLLDGEAAALGIAIEITRDDFESMIESCVAEALEAVREVTAQGQPTDLLLIGGSTLVPFVRRRLEGASEAVLLPSRPEHQVVQGAALLAAGLRVELDEGGALEPAAAVGLERPSGTGLYEAPVSPPASLPPAPQQTVEQTMRVFPGQRLNLLVEIDAEGAVRLLPEVVGEPRPAQVAEGAPARQTMVASPERWVGRELLEQSTNSQTWQAVDALTGRVVRIRHYPADSDLSRGFFLNCLNGLGIEHPGMARILDFGQRDGAYFVVSEWDEWPNLRAVAGGTEGQRSFGPEWSLEVVRQATAGVAALHARRICHRNLKPSNLLVQADGPDVRVTDLDHATSLVGRDYLGDVVGTVPYMAAEVTERRTDLRSDVYALGVILFELLTGYLPYSAPTQRELIEAIRSHPTPTASHFNPELPPWVDSLLLRLLDKDPARRPADAGVLGEELAGLSFERDEHDSETLRDVAQGDLPRAPQDAWERKE